MPVQPQVVGVSLVGREAISAALDAPLGVVAPTTPLVGAAGVGIVARMRSTSFLTARRRCPCIHGGLITGPPADGFVDQLLFGGAERRVMSSVSASRASPAPGAACEPEPVERIVRLRG